MCPVEILYTNMSFGVQTDFFALDLAVGQSHNSPPVKSGVELID